MPESEARYRRNRLGGLRRYHPEDHPAVVEARRELDVCNLADHIAEVVAGWPPLTPAQIDCVAALLRAGRPT